MPLVSPDAPGATNTVALPFCPLAPSPKSTHTPWPLAVSSGPLDAAETLSPRIGGADAPNNQLPGCCWTHNGGPAPLVWRSNSSGWLSPPAVASSHALSGDEAATASTVSASLGALHSPSASELQIASRDH